MSRGRPLLPELQIADEFAGADAMTADAAVGTLTLAGNATRANAFGTLTLAGQPLNTETVTVAGRTYTFLTVLVDAAGNVLIGADASASLDNLIAAINGSAGAGTLYGTGTAVHATVVAAAGAGDTMTATARTAGTAGNALATTETLTSGSWGAATLASGAVAETVTVGSRVYTLVDYLTAANQVLRGASASATLDNLIAALNGAAGEGTTYGTGTVAHADVTAAAGAGDTMDVAADVTGTGGNAIATTETMAQGSWGATTLTGGSLAGAEIEASQRTDRAWVIVRRGSGGSGAVTVANAFLAGQIVSGDGEEFDKFAVLGSMDIAAGQNGRAVLVEGIGAWGRVAFNSDAIAGDTVDVFLLFITD